MTELENVINILQTEFKNLRGGKHYSLKYTIDNNGSEIIISRDEGICHNLNKKLFGFCKMGSGLVYTPVILKWLANKNNLRKVKTDIHKLDIIDNCREIYEEVCRLQDNSHKKLAWYNDLSQKDLLKKTTKQLYSIRSRLRKAANKAIKNNLATEKAVQTLANKILNNLSD